MPNDNRIPKKRFISVIMQAASISDAARELGCTRQAVSLRLQRWKDRGVKGLPTFSKELDVDEVQKLVNSNKRGRSK